MSSFARISLVAAIAVSFGCPGTSPGQCPGTSYSGICFPDGDLSFADVVIAFDPLFGVAGGGCAPGANANPSDSLGPPDVSSTTLGEGGLIELGFLDNDMTNSGDGTPDLHIFEVGPDVENTFVAIRPADSFTLAMVSGVLPDTSPPDGYFEIGFVGGGVASIDIDALIPGAAMNPGTLRFDAVQLIDDVNQFFGCTPASTSTLTYGADIDAVGAISSSQPTYPGSLEDFFLQTGVNGPPDGGVFADVKQASAGDFLTIHFLSPGGTFDFSPPLLGAQLFPTGTPPGSPAGFPEVHMNPSASPAPVIVFDGANAGPLGPYLLVPGGITLGQVVPTGLAGSSVMLQAFCLSPTANNGIFAATIANEIQVL